MIVVAYDLAAGALYWGACWCERFVDSRSVVLFVAVAAGAASLVTAQATRAENHPDFKSKTVSVSASFEAGGPYDFYSRLVAAHIGAHLPGNPAVVVQNMPGAGGLRVPIISTTSRRATVR